MTTYSVPLNFPHHSALQIGGREVLSTGIYWLNIKLVAVELEFNIISLTKCV